MRLIFALTFWISSHSAAMDAVCARAYAPPSKQEINVSLAEKAGLHYNLERAAGYSRKGFGQGKELYFKYFDSQGKQIVDEGILARIAALKIPPAWEQVWISADPLSHVQVQGLDARQRLQSRYHSLWETEVKGVAKYDRMEKFGAILPKLNEAVARDLEKSSDDENARLAAVVRLMDIAGIRIGSVKSAKENEHYGLTTLKIKHVVSVGKKLISFSFIGKEGVAHEITVKDQAVANLIREIIQQKKPDQLLFDVTDDAVNDYIKANTSAEFSAKDIRTWVGTVTAAKFLYDSGPPPVEPAQLKKVEEAAATATADRLGNEMATARDNYIDPFIFKAYRSGLLAEVFHHLTPGTRPLEEQAVLVLMSEKNKPK